MAAGYRSPLPILGLAAGSVTPAGAGVRSLLAPWMGGACIGMAPTTSTGPRSMLAFWMGGAAVGLDEARARSRWLEYDPEARPRHHHFRRWGPAVPPQPAEHETTRDVAPRIRPAAKSSAHQPDGKPALARLMADGGPVSVGVSTLSGRLRALDDEEALILALLMADD